MAGFSRTGIAIRKVQVFTARTGGLLAEPCLCPFLVVGGHGSLCGRFTFRSFGGGVRRRLYGAMNNLRGLRVRASLRHGGRVVAELFSEFVAAGRGTRARWANDGI